MAVPAAYLLYCSLLPGAGELTMRRFFADFSSTAALAALLAVIVSFAGSAVIIFQAAHLAGLSPDVTASWIWAVSIGSGITGILLSWRMKAPIITAWSTPGAALLVVMLPGIPFPEAVGAYLASAAIITLIGVTGSLDALMRRIPSGVGAGMFAGILFSFGAKVFSSIPVDPVLALPMFFVFVVFRRFSPRYSVMAVMLAGIAIAAFTGGMQGETLHLALAKPVWTSPVWSWTTVVSLGIPLALVTLTGQYISGMAVLHVSGYSVPSNGIMTVTGVFSLLLAPFGSHAVNLSSLTAAICTGKEAHNDPDRRYVSGVVCGALYIVVGLFGTTLITLFASLPTVFIAVLAGLALLSAFTTGITGVVKDSDNLEAGVIAFLATASGIEFLGLGSPFWGLVLGGLTYLVLKKSQ